MSRNLTPAELAEFREIFDLVDKDKGGSIDQTELLGLMETLGIYASREEIDIMVSEIDGDGNGEIDFDEFVEVMSRKVNASYSKSQVKRAFKTFETHHAPTGYVTMESLKKALMSYGTEKLDESTADELLSQLEPDSYGRLNYEEYVEMMMSGSD